ncbi:MAG: hypothetical protein IPP61_05070 [Cytophagaceae bacterium]|nr:hypothetical protein [Cytophagaceae bacterium]MBL0324540.1 hypothetical protein [Cytophagaceae bacterium]
MFDIFKKDIQIGDHIKLYLMTGKEPEGIVLGIGENFVLLQSEDLTQNKFFDKLIGGWDLVLKKKLDNHKEKGIRLSRIAREFEISIQELVGILETQEIRVDVNPNVKLSNEDFEKVKLELSKLGQPSNNLDLENFIENEIKNEDNNNPISDSKLWKLYAQKTGKVIKPNRIIETRKNLGYLEYFNRRSKIDNNISDELISGFDKIFKFNDKHLETFLSPNAEINRYFFKYSNGSAKNEDLDRILFKNDVVCDLELINELKNYKWEELIPIVCSYTKIGKNAIAQIIFKPCTVEELIWKIEELIKINDKKRASSLLAYLQSLEINVKEISELSNRISILPDILEIKELQNSITVPLDEKYNFSQIYEKARKLRLKKNFDEAEKQFKILIKNKFQLDSAAKDLADQYREQGRINEAIQLIESHLDFFEKPLPANNFLYDLYVNTGNLEKAKNVLLKIVDTPIDNSNKIEVRSRGKVLARLGALFLKNGQDEVAEKYFQKSYELFPDNKLLPNTSKKIIGKPKNIIKSNDKNQTYLSRLIYGVTPFLELALENCDYEGISLKSKEKRDFSEKTLTNLQNKIQQNSKTYTYKLPKSKAALYLTLARLMKDLEIAEEDSFYDSLAIYCFSMARVAIVERLELDYCLEWFYNGFRQERNKDRILQQVWRFVQTLIHFKDGQEITEDYDPKVLTQQLEIALKLDVSYWNYILLLINSSNIAGNILIDSLSKNSLNNEYITKYLVSVNSYDSKLTQNQNWNNYHLSLEEKLQETYSRTNNILQRENINDVINYFHSIKNQVLDSLLLPVDKFRFEAISKMISSAESFLSSSKFDDKEIYYTDFDNKYNILITEIRSYPTNLSLSLLLQIISQLNKLTRYKYNEFINATLPNVDINIEGDCILNENNNCDIQVSISNSPNCSPISDIVISVIDTNDFQIKNSYESFSTTLRGGGEPIIGKFSINFPESVIKQGAADLTFAYKFRVLTTGEEKAQSKTLSIAFYDSKNFVEVQNPYAEHAKSNIVENPEMFKGRTELINRIYDTVMSTKSKGYVLYGQKRSGKSSVLWHLENKFNTSLKAFAVYYQVGLAIAQDSNVEANFYYRILTTIERKINRLKSLGEIVPEIGKTNLKELMLNPPIVFYDRLNEIKLAFSEHDEWRDKKLVLIIDEFTYIYYQIKKGTISQTFMQNWKAFIEDGGFSVVVSGQDTMKQFMLEFQNEFGMFKPERLTYLDVKPAKELIDEPIWDKVNNRSRYTRDSIDKIISLTARSPFYIQIICNELVRFMNEKKKPVLTPRDVEDVVISLCKGQNSLTEFDFENLLSAGDKQLDHIKPDEAFAILSEMAKLTKTLNFARREDISVYSINKDSEIIKDLIERAVLEEESLVSNRYKIRVQLFKDWLNFNNN